MASSRRLSNTQLPLAGEGRGQIGANTAARWENAAIGFVGGVLGIVALTAGPLVWLRPNRIVEGDAVVAIDALGAFGWVALGLWVLATLGGLWRGSLAERWTRLVDRSGTGRSGATVSAAARALLASATFLLLLVEVGRVAATFAASEGTAARTSLGWCFYLFSFAFYLFIYAAAADSPRRAARLALVALPFVGLVLLVAFGALRELGLVREWALARSTFAREAGRHLFYALGATGGAVVFGIPLGILAARHRRTRSAVVSLLNLGQVLPVLAFIGIMMPILSSLSDALPGLKSLGISGIGWAPVMVVLFVYALYPVTRNTMVAIQQLDPAILDTAKGMGMRRGRTLWEVELPLAFPVVLAGVRIALVQTTAGAIIAAFVGGGGLGTIVFLGLEQTSMDLVLVGVIPIVALALCFDAFLRMVEYLVGRRQKTKTAMVAL